MIYDISQPLFECVVFPGDPAPEKKPLLKIENGDSCNLTALSMCAHNGTHVDAPLHFIEGGKGIDQVALEKFIGTAYVETHSGEISAEDAREILARAKKACGDAGVKILIRGKAVLTAEGAQVLAEAGIDLFGNESQTVGPEDAPAAVHKIMLGAEVVLLEGIRLGAVPDGTWFLNCAPLNLTDTDGAPCRAVLVTEIARGDRHCL